MMSSPAVASCLPQLCDWYLLGPDAWAGRDTESGEVVEVRVAGPDESSRLLSLATLARQSPAGWRCVLDAGLSDTGTAWVVLAREGDESLSERLAGRFDERAALTLCERLAATLQTLHAAQQAYLSLNPERVWLAELSRPRLDLPPARAAEPGRWTAPERRRGLPLDLADQARLDVYALAALLHGCLIGSPPPRPGKPDIFALEQRDVSRPLQKLLLRALATDANQRPATIGALRNRLQDLLHTNSEAPPAGRDEAPSALGSCGPYQLIEELARGGMGVVYKALDPRLERCYALKRMLYEPRGRDTERFLREARTLARLRHPGIVTVHEVDFERGAPYMVMDLIEGGSLRERLRTGPMPVDEALKLLTRVAQAMHHAHGEGIVHRDLKPGNVLLDAQGLPLVSDFGLAWVVDARSELTGSGALLGTLGYMPPEQASGARDALGPWTDVYALGSILYEMVTGHKPFFARSSLELLRQIQHSDPVPPTRWRPDLPADVAAIIGKCLEKEPRRRYDSAAALAADIDRFRSGRPVEARPLSRLGRLARTIRRHKGIAAVVFGVFALVTGFLGFHIARIESKNEEISARWAIAERRREIAESTLVSLSDDVQRRLRFRLGDARANAVAEHMLEVAIDGWQKLAAVSDEDHAARAGAARAKTHLARLVQLLHGQRARAEELLEEAVTELEELYRAHPTADLALDYADAVRELSQRRLMTDLPASRELGLRAVAVCRELVEWTGARPHQRMLALTLRNLAKIEDLVRGLEPALACVTEAVASARRLVSGDGADVSASSLLCSTLLMRAEFLLRRGLLCEADADVREALAAARRIDALGSSDLRVPEQVAGCLRALGLLHRRRGQAESAALVTAEALAISERRLALDSAHVETRHEVVRCLLQLADSRDDLGLSGAAIALLVKAERLLDGDRARLPDLPEIHAWQADVAGLLARARARHQPANGVRPLEAAVSAVRAQLSRLPGSRGYGRALFHTLIDLATAQTAGGDLRAGLQTIAEARTCVQDLIAEDSADVYLRRSLASAVQLEALILLQLGAFDASQAAAETSLRLFAEAHAGSGDTLWQRIEEAGAGLMLAQVLRSRGRPEPARSQAMTSLGLLEKLDAPVHCVLYTRALRNALDLLTDILLDLDQLDAAEDCAARELALQRQIFARDSTSVETRLLLASSMQSLADVLVAREELDQALPLRHAALEISSTLAEEGDASASSLFRHAVDLGLLARAVGDRGASAQELELRRRSFAVWQALVASDSANIRWRTHHAACAASIGLVLSGQGLYAEALPWFEQGLATYEEMLAAAPDHLPWLVRHARMRINWHGTTIHTKSTFREWLPTLRPTLEAVEAVLEQTPEDPSWWRHAAQLHGQLGWVHGSDDPGAAQEAFWAAAEARRVVVSLRPGDFDAHARRAEALRELAQVERRRGALPEAREAVAEALESVTDALACDEQPNAQRLALAETSAALGRDLLRFGSVEEALPVHERARELAIASRDESRPDDWAIAVTGCELERGESMLFRGELAEVQRTCEALVTLLKKVDDKGGFLWWDAAGGVFLLWGRVVLLEGDRDVGRQLIFRAGQLRPERSGVLAFLLALDGDRTGLDQLDEPPALDPPLRYLVGEVDAAALLAWAEEQADPGALSRAHACIALRHDFAGEPDRARPHYRAVLEAACCEPYERSWALLRLAEVDEAP